MNSHIKYFSLAFFLLIFTSCDNYKEEVEKMKAENEKMSKQLSDIELEEKMLRGEYAEAMNALNSIDDTLSRISDREKEIKELKKDIEITKSKSQKEEMLDKINELVEENKNSKKQVKQLQALLQKFKGENESLRKMIDQAESRVETIEEDLSSKRNTIGNMRSTLKKTEKELAENQSNLSIAYEDLKDKNDKLEAANARLEQLISELKIKDEFIGKEAWGYVCCGSKKYLRQRDILNNTTLKLTKNYQANVQASGSRINYYESNIIDCGISGKITTVLPARDPQSYKIEANKLIVKNPELFWKLDKVVVLVKDK
jgi:DNA repair exonuclease SbcCD ATPase subunit